ncbi:hypothetical protein AVEN_3929-1, partial [Araneus ventricosus]
VPPLPQTTLFRTTGLFKRENETSEEGGKMMTDDIMWVKRAVSTQWR